MRTAAYLLIVILTALRLYWLRYFCGIDLAPDEAHYWDWARHLDLSYYSKGPLVAWVIRGSLETLGDSVFAVRFPAAIFGGLLLLGLHTLARLILVDHPRREALALMVVAFAATLPAVGAGSLLMTIDSPFVCLWTWALVAGWLAIRSDRSAWWLLTGALVGLGILAKYTMALWPFSLAVLFVMSPGWRARLWSRGFLLMTATAFVGCLPILIWNVHNDFVTFQHVAVQAGTKSAGFRPFGPLEYVGGQMAILIGYWFICWVAAMLRMRPRRDTPDGIRYLWWMSLPTFLVFGTASLRAAGQINWPVSAYLSGMVLAAIWVDSQINHPSKGWRNLCRGILAFALLLGIGMNLLMHDTTPVRPLMATLAGEPTAENPFPIRRFDPSCRLRGWKYLASEVDRVRDEVRRTEGGEAVVSGLNWMMPGELGFYCQGHPTVYTLGPRMGDRHSQYDLWHPNPIDEPEAFLGKTFVFVGFGEPMLERAFGEVLKPRRVEYSEDGRPIAAWLIWVCRDFRGFPKEVGPDRKY